MCLGREGGKTTAGRRTDGGAQGNINERCGRSVHRLEAAFTAHNS